MSRFCRVGVNAMTAAEEQYSENNLRRLQRLDARIERLEAAIKKYLSHQVSHQETYAMFRRALEDKE